MSKFFQDQPLYVFLFTDYPNPEELKRSFEEQINAPNIQFACRKDNKVDLMEDFFGLTQFDCLIRADSNFSIAAEKISDYKVVIYPLNPCKKGQQIEVDRVGIKWSEDL